MRPRLRLSFAAALLLSSGLLQPLVAQGRFGDEQTRLQREAAALESSGDLEGAERALRRLIELNPVSMGSIYALERVLRARGELVSLLPLVDGFLTRREDTGMRSLKLQLLVEADSLETLVAEAEWWIERDPRIEAVYAEVARAYEPAFGHERAMAVLLGGRARLGGDALALAIGDHFAEDGDQDAAIDEWARSIDEDGLNVLVVRRRIEGLAENRTEAARRLVSNLAASELAARRQAGTRLAIELGLGAEALDLVRQETATLQGAERTEYLQEISVAATAAGVSEVAAWAYGQLGSSEEDPDDRRMLEQRRAEAALAARDTSAALDAFERVAASLPEGSSERRLVVARAIRIAAAARDVDRIRILWETFVDMYPDAPEADALGAVTAAALVAWGDVEGALDVLEAVSGPRSAIERAYLLIASGEIAVGVATFMEAVGGLPPSEATEIIQLAALLGRVSGTGAQVLANASVQAHLGRGAAAAVTLADEAFDVPGPDRPLLLAEAARMADRAGAAQAAADIRGRLVREYPEAPETGEASLALARHRAGAEGDSAEAIRLLEDLITRQPNAAVVPEARLELERLRSRGT